jgi:hypothetical protein
MKKIIIAVVVVLAAVVVVAVVGGIDGPSTSESSTTSDTRTPAATRTTDSRPAPVDPDTGFSGTVTTTFRGTRGSQNVRCESIDTEFAVAPHGGRMRWTAQAFDRYPGNVPYRATAAAGVVVEPAAGELAAGQRIVVRVRGTFAGRQFWVGVQSVRPSGSVYAGNAIEFRC